MGFEFAKYNGANESKQLDDAFHKSDHQQALINSTADLTSEDAHDYVGRLVNFRRDRLTSAFVYEYGTMAVDTVYKVVNIVPGTKNKQVKICAEFFPLAISVSIDDIELANGPRLDYDRMIKPYEHLLGLSDAYFCSESNK